MLAFSFALMIAMLLVLPVFSAGVSDGAGGVWERFWLCFDIGPVAGNVADSINSTDTGKLASSSFFFLSQVKIEFLDLFFGIFCDSQLYRRSVYIV